MGRCRALLSCQSASQSFGGSLLYYVGCLYRATAPNHKTNDDEVAFTLRSSVLCSQGARRRAAGFTKWSAFDRLAGPVIAGCDRGTIRVRHKGDTRVSGDFEHHPARNARIPRQIRGADADQLSKRYLKMESIPIFN